MDVVWLEASKKGSRCYAYATRAGGDWKFDLHVGKAGNAPCFGWDVPPVYLPISTVFPDVYLKCKRIRLGEIDECTVMNSKMLDQVTGRHFRSNPISSA
jgi:hypothetical protein